MGKLLLNKKNIIAGKNIMMRGMPILQINKNATLVIGDNVVLNSINYGYHVNMFSPCKIMLDRPGALIKIGNNTRIHGTCIHAYNKIVIGKNCLIAANSQIFDGNGHNLSFDNVKNRINTKGEVKEIIIEDNVWIGTGVIVLPGVRIGYGSVISANSVVHKNVPSMCIAGGNPLRVIKKYSNVT